MKVLEPEYLDPPDNPAAAVGRDLLLAVRNAGRALLILGEAILWLPEVFRRRRETVRELYLCGVKSIGVTSTVALFTGMILSLQAGLVLRDYGQQVQVGTLVAQTMCREMGPFMTALILAASVGSAMAAEIGTMAVSEEISALHVMSINPVRFLVTPRLAAFIIMCPVLTIYTNVVGVMGGMLVAYTQLGVAPSAYYRNALEYLHNKAVYVGLLKALVFGAIVVTVACYQGLSARDGAVGVGRATRKTVVHSFLLVLVTGYVITRLFY
ncbi:MAG: ABC transporter permease [Kiritimatiellaeota bacterium]|nr:ABC transporter permease [Kiritimatiellota bacterium]